jgi:hypothetical protein
MNCSICGKTIDGPYLTEVTGWVASRKAGGANAIRAKKETGNVAHRIDPRHRLAAGRVRAPDGQGGRGASGARGEA